MRSKDVGDRAARDAKKGAAGRSSEEPTDQQGRDVVGKSATKIESEEEAEPDKVDGTAAVEFREWAEHEREEAQAEDEEGQAQGGDFGTDVELALDGGVGERDHGRAGRDAERGGGHDDDDGPFPKGSHVERSVGGRPRSLRVTCHALRPMARSEEGKGALTRADRRLQSI